MVVIVGWCVLACVATTLGSFIAATSLDVDRFKELCVWSLPTCLYLAVVNLLFSGRRDVAWCSGATLALLVALPLTVAVWYRNESSRDEDFYLLVTPFMSIASMATTMAIAVPYYIVMRRLGDIEDKARFRRRRS
jgi:hypothetical protein